MQFSTGRWGQLHYTFPQKMNIPFILNILIISNVLLIQEWSSRNTLLPVYTLGAPTTLKLWATFLRTDRIIRKWSRVIVHTSLFHAAMHFWWTCSVSAAVCGVWFPFSPGSALMSVHSRRDVLASSYTGSAEAHWSGQRVGWLWNSLPQHKTTLRGTCIIYI